MQIYRLTRDDRILNEILKNIFLESRKNGAELIISNRTNYNNYIQCIKYCTLIFSNDNSSSTEASELTWNQIFDSKSREAIRRWGKWRAKKATRINASWDTTHYNNVRVLKSANKWRLYDDAKRTCSRERGSIFLRVFPLLRRSARATLRRRWRIRFPAARYEIRHSAAFRRVRNSRLDFLIVSIVPVQSDERGRAANNRRVANALQSSTIISSDYADTRFRDAPPSLFYMAL